MPFFKKRLISTFLLDIAISIPFAIIYYIVETFKITTNAKIMFGLLSIPTIIFAIIYIFDLRAYYYGVRDYVTYIITNILVYSIFAVTSTLLGFVAQNISAFKTIYPFAFLPAMTFVPIHLNILQSNLFFHLIMYIIIILAPAEMISRMRSKKYRDGML